MNLFSTQVPPTTCCSVHIFSHFLSFFLPPSFLLFSLCPPVFVDLYLSQSIKQISTNYVAMNTLVFSFSLFSFPSSSLPLSASISVSHTQYRLNSLYKSISVCFSPAEQTIRFERLFRCLCGFFLQMRMAPDVKPPNEAYPNFHSPPIWSTAAFF